MKENNKIIINCVDSGNIFFKPGITLGEINDFLNIKDEKKAFESFLENKILEPGKLLKLTELDFHNISLYYSEYLEIKDKYILFYKQISDVRKAFYKTIEDYINLELMSFINPFKKQIELMTKKIIPDNFINSFKNVIKNNNYYFSTLAESIRKLGLYLNFSIIINQPFNQLQETAKSFSTFYSNDLINNLKKVDSLFKNSFSIINSQNNYFLSLSKNINKINEEFIKKTINISQLNSLIINSNKFILNTNNYFTNKRPLAEITNEENKASKDLISDLGNAESLLYNESKETIINTNNLLENQRFKNEIKSLKNDIDNYKPILDRLKILFNPPKFIDILKQFALNLSKGSWKIFWIRFGDKFISNPERHAKVLLSNFLSGLFLGQAFIGPEICSGNGYIDILVYLCKYTYIFEIKILGVSWNIGWVESGIPQLFNYMNNYGVDTGYLVVFDGRKTNKGKQLSPFYKNGDKIINVIIAKIYF